MQIDDFLRSIPLAPFTMPQIAWLAGAVAGLKFASNRSPSWLWEDFYEDIYEMIGLIGHVEPADPGTSPQDGDGQVGSAFEALGGYVSVVGEMTPVGLYFRVPLSYQGSVIQLLDGLTILHVHGEIVIAAADLPAFLRLVPIKGPLAEWLEEEDIL
ncbi:MAG: hypothetical protein AM325_004795 [Candidatus Thorarchaeota archaeon SMTZ1-45]|nr:MAG: hypothetical protein AM325_06560 [Candidatus Thorarchaeota archaeon SMTZ1-45]